jgi:glycosyltransferase involved in cell wall biosynthesis
LEIITGRPRPRHLRFAAAIADLVPGAVLERRDRSLIQRLRTNAMCRVTGIREVGLARSSVPTILHQALSSTATPYIAEYDVPLALHGYSYSAFLQHADKARRLLEMPSMRAMFVFSEWAKRSFALHFGEEAGAKCRISYPLASDYANHAGQERVYDFSFISINFRVKGGPELVRAFKAVRHSVSPDVRMCIVTNLNEARKHVGDLDSHPGIEWRDSNLGEREIASLLSQTHCLVHPTLWDSFGVVILEAVAAGCAVITSRMASIPELVTPENGILLDLPLGQVVGDMTIPQFSDVNQLSTLLSRLNLRAFEDDLTSAMITMTQPARRSAFQSAARDLYRARFSRDAWNARMRRDLQSQFPDLDMRQPVDI